MPSSVAPQLWQFPDEDERIFGEVEALRRLTARERFARTLDLIQLTTAMHTANPPTQAARQVRQRDEEQWQDAFRKLYEQHGCYRRSETGTD
jgi:hypothetical protein